MNSPELITPPTAKPWQMVTTQARDIAQGSVGFCVLLGGGMGFLFGHQLPALLPGQFVLITQLVLGLVLGKSATVIVTLILALRMAFRFRQLTQGGSLRLGQEIVASGWGLLLGYVVFMLAALLGFAFGVEVSGAVSGYAAMRAVEQHYALAHLLHALLRMLASAVLLGWMAYAVQGWARQRAQVLGVAIAPSPMLLLTGCVLGLLLIEGLDTWFWAAT